MNNFVDFINGFYSQNISQDSSYSELSEFKLQGITLRASNIIKDLKSGKISVLILTGNAGDGKTFLCEQIFKELIDSNFTNEAESYSRYNEQEVIIIKDASELEEEKLIFHINEIEDILYNKAEKDIIYILAGNEGRLSEAFNNSKTRKLFYTFEKALDIDTYNTSTKEITNLEIINFSFRNLTTKKSFFSIIDSFTNIINWENNICDTCNKKGICTILCNIKLLREQIVKENIRIVFQLFYLTQGHFTLRELLSAIAFIITGNQFCENIKIDKRNIFILYNTIFSKHKEKFIQGDRLLNAISLFDVAFTPMPQINKYLQNFDQNEISGPDLFFLNNHKEKDIIFLSSLKRRMFLLYDIKYWGSSILKTKNIDKLTDVEQFLPLDCYSKFIEILNSDVEESDIITAGLNLLIDKNNDKLEPVIILYHPYQKNDVKLSLNDKFLDVTLDKSMNIESRYIENELNSFKYCVDNNGDVLAALEINLSMFQMLFHTYSGHQSIIEYQKHSRKIEEFREELYYQIENSKDSQSRLEYQIGNSTFVIKKNEIRF